MWRNRRVGKGGGTAVAHREVPRAPCPRVLAQLRIMTAWARRTRVFAIGKFRAGAFAHPTRPCITLSQKKIGPCLRLWARGSPAFLFFRLPRKRGGLRADKAHARIPPGVVAGF